MSAVLRPARGLRLDADEAGGLTYGVLAKKGAGKTYTGRVMAEEMFDAGIPFVALDPTGAWWGLRAGADGTKKGGLPVPIFGGDQADAPLEPTAGQVMADLVVDDGLSMILDVSKFGTRAAERRFAHAFLERLYRRNRDLVHLFVDEADLFAPQKPASGDQPLLGVMENLVRRGRIKGIGCTLITQRPAVLNKDVLTQIDVLVALRILSPQDRAAIDKWIEGHGEAEKRRAVFDSLASLQNGESWWWAPEQDLFKQVKVRAARTFDSSPTPRRGARRREPKKLADIDLAAVEQRIAGTIERAKAEDPRELRRRIGELERELKERPAAAPAEPERVEVEVPVVAPEAVEALRSAATRAESIESAAQDARLAAERALESLDGLPARSPTARPGAAAAAKRPAPAPAPRPAPRATPPSRASSNGGEPAVVGDFEVTASQRRILDALAMLEAIGVPQADKTQLALFARTRPTSGGYKNNLGALRNQAGLIEYPTPGTVALTEAGRQLADATDAPQTTAELHHQVRELVGASKWALLEALVGVYPDSLVREDLADAVGVPPTSGGFKNNLGSLRSLGLIDYPVAGYVAALPVLFLEGARV